MPASALRASQDQIRELQRLLGKKTLEAEILKEALEIATESKKRTLRSLCRCRCPGTVRDRTNGSLLQKPSVALLMRADIDDHRKPIARYGASKSARRERLAPTELHHHWGHDLHRRISKTPVTVSASKVRPCFCEPVVPATRTKLTFGRRTRCLHQDPAFGGFGAGGRDHS
ncbi:MAG: transposase [Methylocystaceae bacterium]|nr:MAG: transposase [Methylocystaceae bacterium]